MNSQSSRRNILGTKEITKATKNTTKKDYKKRFRTDSEHSAWNLYGVRAFCAEYQGECKVLDIFMISSNLIAHTF